MTSKTDSQSNNANTLDTIDNYFKCKSCDAISRPIAETNYYTDPDCYGLDIYVCEYCETCFCLESKDNNFTARFELSSGILHRTDDLPF